MSDFLTLAKRLRSECGISGSGPTAVTAQVGEMERVVNWINAAWVDIQSIHHDWQWLRKSFSFTTTTGQFAYTPAECGITDFGQWAMDTMRCYPTAVGTKGEMFLRPIGYDNFRNIYLYNAFRDVQTRPIDVTVYPDTSLGVGPSPNSTGWTILGDYFAEPSELVLATDVPIMPEKHHMAIIYRAMMMYGAFEAAPEVYQRGEQEFLRILRRMRQDRLPPICAPGALA